MFTVFSIHHTGLTVRVNLQARSVHTFGNFHLHAAATQGPMSNLCHFEVHWSVHEGAVTDTFGVHTIGTSIFLSCLITCCEGGWSIYVHWAFLSSWGHWLLTTVRMIPRKPYQGRIRKLVLAFDVGTTYSGVSYCILDPGEIPSIHGVAR